jgi:hypothetical protein
MAPSLIEYPPQPGLLSLAFESEFLISDIAQAHDLIRTALIDSQKSAYLWSVYSRFCFRTGDRVKASEIALNEAMSCLDSEIAKITESDSEAGDARILMHLSTRRFGDQDDSEKYKWKKLDLELQKITIMLQSPAKQEETVLILTNLEFQHKICTIIRHAIQNNKPVLKQLLDVFPPVHLSTNNEILDPSDSNHSLGELDEEVEREIQEKSQYLVECLNAIVVKYRMYDIYSNSIKQSIPDLTQKRISIELAILDSRIFLVNKNYKGIIAVLSPYINTPNVPMELFVVLGEAYLLSNDIENSLNTLLMIDTNKVTQTNVLQMKGKFQTDPFLKPVVDPLDGGCALSSVFSILFKRGHLLF